MRKEVNEAYKKYLELIQQDEQLMLDDESTDEVVFQKGISYMANVFKAFLCYKGKVVNENMNMLELLQEVIKIEPSVSKIHPMYSVCEGMLRGYYGGELRGHSKRLIIFKEAVLSRVDGFRPFTLDVLFKVSGGSPF